MSDMGEEKDPGPGSVPGSGQTDTTDSNSGNVNTESSASSVPGTETVSDKFSDGNHEAQAHTPTSASRSSPHEHNSQTTPDNNLENTDKSQGVAQSQSTPAGYYNNYQQATPPPNSPAGHVLGYESPYLIPQGAAGANFSRQQFGMIPPPPLSPGQPINVNNGAQLRTPDINDPAAAAAANHNLSMGILAPSSPLFPASMAFVGTNSEHMNMDASNASRMNTASLVAPPSPNVQYISAAGHPVSPGYGGVGIYSNYGGQTIGYPATGNTSLRDIASSPDTRVGTWPVERTQASPHVQSQPLTMPFPGTPPHQSNNIRTASFDEMLPPAVVEDNGNNVYSAPGIAASTSSGGHTMFSQPSWGYNPATVTGPPVPGPAPYSMPPQQQPQQGQGLPPSFGMGGGGNGGGAPRGGLNPRNQQAPGGFYPATTPGPPIQTTHHNKGPDGANLFIFHIPNHFTNLDMWHLFCHYGNLLSVRIMVEKDTGRSRGFGFVSYDSPDAAAMAIKELNGFVIGNKRLKVQHKQIRQSDNTAAQQENAHAPPLFPQIHSMPPSDSVPPVGANGVHHGMMGRTDWLAGSHDATGEPNTIAKTNGQNQNNPDVDSNILLSEAGPKKSENEASLGMNFDGGGTKQHMEAALNLDSIRDALPS